MVKVKSKDYVHPVLNEETTSVSGYYTLTKEARLEFHGREVLYYIGHAAWKIEKSKEGRNISQIEKINDESIQKEIAALLKAKEGVHQVNFN
ncbi:MAG: hypothetical protein JRJ39_17050 [Deltaproteobacteria bacterium]|nr:hypothetical protein [Deltaproteobacteria bacterium]